MKISLYSEGGEILAKSGIGRVLDHQKRASSEVGIEYTLDVDCSDYDILHTNTYSVDSHCTVGKARKLGKKVIYHAHSTEEDFRSSFIGSNQLAPLVKKYLISLYFKADHLTTPAPCFRTSLEGYDIKVPISAISNGIDLPRFYPSKERKQKFREYFRIDEEKKIVIYVGLFFGRKGITDFIEAVRRLPEYQFIWSSDTPMYFISKNIRQLAKEDYPENVIFPGYVRRDVIEGAYAVANLFFFPSREEAEGIIVSETLASQQQVLVRDILAHRDWLVANRNCYMSYSIEEPKKYIEGLLEGRIPSTREVDYQVAEQRSIKQTGYELKEVYETVSS